MENGGEGVWGNECDRGGKEWKQANYSKFKLKFIELI